MLRLILLLLFLIQCVSGCFVNERYNDLLLCSIGSEGEVWRCPSATPFCTGSYHGMNFVWKYTCSVVNPACEFEASYGMSCSAVDNEWIHVDRCGYFELEGENRIVPCPMDKPYCNYTSGLCGTGEAFRQACLNDVVSKNLTDSQTCDFRCNIIPDIEFIDDIKTLQDIFDSGPARTIPEEIGTLFNLKHLSLNGNAITGTIPLTLGNLTTLTHLDLSQNQFNASTTLPADLGNLSGLEILKLETNFNLVGTIPGKLLAGLQNLKVLNISNSGLVNEVGLLPFGQESKEVTLRDMHLWMNNVLFTIPKTMGKMSHLTSIDFKNGQVVGTVPSALANLTMLTSLELQGNLNLTGTVPGTLLNLVHLKNFNITGTRLANNFGVVPSGSLRQVLTCNSLKDWMNSNLTIPPTLGNLTELTSLELSRCGLAGTFPTERMPPKLRKLELQYNPDLRGIVPQVLGSMLETLNIFSTSLENPSRVVPLRFQGKTLDMNNLIEWFNAAQQTIPSEISQLTALTALELSSQSLTGPIPAGLHKLSALKKADFSGNQLTSVEEMAFLSKDVLRELYLNRNRFQVLPVNLLTEMPSLKILRLEENMLADRLTGLLNVVALEELSLSNNNFTTLPSNLESLTNLKYFAYENNVLQGGTIPAEVGLLSQLTHLKLSNSSIAGPLDVEWLRQLTHLEVFDVKGNQLTGPIVHGFVDWVNLTWFDVGNNLLTGTTPNEFSRLTNLQHFDVGNNLLSGSFPETIVHCNDMEHLNLQGNRKFSGTLPETLGQLTKLSTLFLDDMNLHGEIPNSLGNCTALEVLHLNDNTFHGRLPEFDKLKQLKELYVQNNPLTGIPSFESLDRLSTLWITNTKFACNCLMKNWLQPLLDKPGFLLINLDNTLCGNANEYSGLPAQMLKFQANQPCSNPENLQVVNITSSGAILNWTYDESLGVDIPAILVPREEEDVFDCNDIPRKPFNPNATLAYQVELRDADRGTTKEVCKYFPGLNITGLEPYKSYQVSVRVLHIRWDYNEIQHNATHSTFMSRTAYGPRTLTETFVTEESIPSSVPDSIVVSDRRETTVTITWEPPVDANGEIRNYHLILIDLMSGQVVHERNTSLPIANNFNLDKNRAYEVAIAAETKIGRGPRSTFVEFQTEPPCPPGAFRFTDDGAYRCEPCPLHTYKSINDTICKPCPERFPVTLLKGSVSMEEDCVTDAGSFKNFDGTTMICEDDQLPGVDCDMIVAGLTIHTLPILNQYWRFSNETLDIRECPILEYCSQNLSSRQCPGVDCCVENHRGIFCMECAEGFVMKSEGCVQCTEEQMKLDQAFVSIILVFASLVMLSPAIYLVQVARGKLVPNENNIVQRFRKRFVPSTTKVSRLLGPKVRLLISFLQVAITFSKENDVINLGMLLDVVNLDISSVLQIRDLGCSWANTDYFQYVLMYTLAPLIMIFCMVVAMLIVKVILPRERLKVAEGVLAHFVLQLLFILYPGVASSLFKMFVFEKFERFEGDPDPYFVLQVDYTVPFDEVSPWRLYSGLMIITYPIGGIALFYACARWYFINRNDEKTINGPVAKSMEFLCQSYKPEFYWYECFELFRRLMLSSIFVVIHQHLAPATAKGVYVLMLVVFLAILLRLKPYVNDSDQILAESAMLALIFKSQFTNMALDDVTVYVSTMIVLGMEFCVTIYLFFKDVQFQGKVHP